MFVLLSKLHLSIQFHFSVIDIQQQTKIDELFSHSIIDKLTTFVRMRTRRKRLQKRSTFKKNFTKGFSIVTIKDGIFFVSMMMIKWEKEEKKEKN